MTSRRRDRTIDDYLSALTNGDRATLGQAITLVESVHPDDHALAQQLLQRLMPLSGKARRVGITGVPGVGKSTFIEQLGKNLIAEGHRVAVLAIDPSSSLSGGSILGDKTRMVELARESSAFIRPSPSAGSLGGVALRTREAIIVCEAAGFDVILVETVGVGQSETVVADMVDFFLVLALAGGGDELQGIKRGLMELADLIAINKADGDNRKAAELAQREYAQALSYLRLKDPPWKPPVVTCSGLKNLGLSELWQQVVDHHVLLSGNGRLVEKRQAQQLRWMWSAVESELLSRLRSHPAVQSQLAVLEQSVREGDTAPGIAASRLLDAFGQTSKL